MLDVKTPEGRLHFAGFPAPRPRDGTSVDGGDSGKEQPVDLSPHLTIEWSHAARLTVEGEEPSPASIDSGDDRGDDDEQQSDQPDPGRFDQLDRHRVLGVDVDA